MSVTGLCAAAASLAASAGTSGANASWNFSC
jgi:hypothetical protein